MSEETQDEDFEDGFGEIEVVLDTSLEDDAIYRRRSLWTQMFVERLSMTSSIPISLDFADEIVTEFKNRIESDFL
jgi:hypothetical protein